MRSAGACIAVPLGTTHSELIVAEVGCASVKISTIQVIGPTGTSQSTVASYNGISGQYYVTMYWTPVASQVGPNVICSTAIDNTYLNSAVTCFTLLAGIDPPALLNQTGTPSGLLSAATLAGNNGVITWSVQFNMNVTRPTLSTYISLYSSNGTLIFQMDASVFPTITYYGDTLSFQTGNSFSSGTYYWTFGYGVGLGDQYCLPQSEAVTYSSFWTFTVASTTTTTLATATVPTTLSG